MIVYPSIDVRGGRVVRLLYGDPDFESVYDYHPAAVAQRWKDAGASWVHVISLDGTLEEGDTALGMLREVVATGVKVQYGGGIRSLDIVEQAFKAGATRVVLGTLVAEQPELAEVAIKRFGTDILTVALDAKNGKVATHGWQQTSRWTPVELGKRFAEVGFQHALYTDISHDGDLSGVNVNATAALARDTGLQVIASGGVSSLDDIRALRETGQVAGVVIGRALYAEVFSLQEALSIANE